MRILFLNTVMPEKVPKSLMEDLQTEKYSDFHFLNFDFIREQVKYDHWVESGASENQLKKLVRQTLLEQIELIKKKTDSTQKIGLPTNPTIIMLHKWENWGQYSGEVKFLPLDQKQPIAAEGSFGKHLSLSIYFDPKEEERPPSKSKAKNAPTAYVPVCYIIDGQMQLASVQTAIAQYLVVDFSLREIYLETMKKSSVVNISGKSLRLSVYPTIFTTPADPELIYLYNTQKQLKQEVSVYNFILQECKEDQNEIPVLLGAMIDSVLTCNLKQTCQPSYYDSQLLFPEDDLIESEQNCQQYKIFDQSAAIDHPVSLFDTYSCLLSKFHTAQGRYYLHRAVNAVLASYIANHHISEPKYAMKQEFSELVRMFMKDIGEEISLRDAESIIRKSILCQKLGTTDLVLTEPFNQEVSSENMIKLGSFEEKAFNELSTIAQMSVNQIVPTKEQTCMVPMTGSIIHQQELDTGVNGVVQTKFTQQQLKFAIENEVEKICKLAVLEYSPSIFRRCAPSYDEWVVQLFKQQIFKNVAVQVDPKVKDKQPEKKELAFKIDQINQQELCEVIEETENVGQKKAVDKKAAPKPPVLNPFVPAFQNQIITFFQYVVHNLYKQNKNMLFESITTLYENQGGLVEFLGLIAKNKLGISKQQKQIETKDSKKPEKDKQKEDSSTSAMTFLTIDLHLAFAYLISTTFGDEKMINVFNELMKITEEISEDSQKLEPLFYFHDAQNVTFLNNSVNQDVKGLLSELLQNIQIIATAPGFLKYKPLQAKVAPIDNDYQIQQARQFSDYFVHVSDRSVIKSNVLDQSLQLTRTVAGISSDVSEQFSSQSSMQDKLSLMKVYSIPNIQKRVVQSSPGAQRAVGKQQAPVQQPTFQLPPEILSSRLTRQFIEPEQPQSNIYPTFSQLSGTLLDGQRISFVDQQLTLQCNDSIIKMQINGQLMIYQNDMQFVNKENQIKFKNKDKEIQFDDCNNIKQPENLVEQNNFFSDVKSKYFQDVKIFENLSVDQTVLKILYNVLNSFTICQFEAELDQFEGKQNVTLIELQQVNCCVLLIGSTKIVINQIGDVLFYKKEAIYVVKADGSAYVFFNVQSGGDETQKALDNPRPASASVTQAQSKSRAADQKKQETKEKTEMRYYSSPIVLYMGQGFALWNSLLEKRARYQRHQNINSRINFDLQKKLNPILQNPEKNVKFEIGDILSLLFKMRDECIVQYKVLPPFSTQMQTNISQFQNINRMHHEMFLPLSSTVVSPLQGVYRFILGGQALPDTPFYPSISILDWSGNTIHVRLGAPFQRQVKVQVQVPKDPKSKVIEMEIREQNVYCQDSNDVILPPLNLKSVQSDEIQQVDNLIDSREKEMLKFLEVQRRPKSAKEEIDPKKQKQPPKPQKGAVVIEEKPVTVEEIKGRSTDLILGELVKVEVKTALMICIDGFIEQKNNQQERLEKITLDDLEFEHFIHTDVKAEIPSPAHSFMQKKLFIIPIKPEFKQKTEFTCSIFDSDVPIVILQNCDIQPLQYIALLSGFAEVPSTSTLQTREMLTFRYLGRLSNSMQVMIPTLVQQITSIISDIARTYKNLTNHLIFQYAVDLMGDALPAHAHPNSVVMFEAATERDRRLWKTLEETKAKWRKIESDRKRSPAVEQGSRSDNALFQEVAGIISAEKRNTQRELERTKQRQQEQEMQNQLQNERKVQMTNPKAEQKVEDYYIDKPMGKNSPKSNTKQQQQVQVQKASLKAAESMEDESDEEFGTGTLRSSQYIQKFPILRGVEQQTVPQVLPRLNQKLVGACNAKLLKVIPDRVNSRNVKNCVILKNLVTFELNVAIEGGDDVVIDQKEFVMKPYESRQLLIQHSKFSDSKVQLTVKGGEQAEVVQVVVYW